jgi:hypothetical protein
MGEVSKTFGIVADLKRGIAVRGAMLCPLCDGTGEVPGVFTVFDLNPENRCCEECGGQGWCPDDVEGEL